MINSSAATPGECGTADADGGGGPFYCGGEATNTKNKPLDTVTADTIGTAAECCEQPPVPGTCGAAFDCSLVDCSTQSDGNTQAKARDTVTANQMDPTAAECCKAPPVPGTCGADFDCSGETTDTKAKAADTATADEDLAGTAAECCEAPVPGTCGADFDCSGETTDTKAKAADTATADEDLAGTAAECCEAVDNAAITRPAATIFLVSVAAAFFI